MLLTSLLTLLTFTLTLTQAKLRYSGRGYGAPPSSNDNLVESLRRQLMHENYDYMSDESDDLLPSQTKRVDNMYDESPRPAPVRDSAARERDYMSYSPRRHRPRPRAPPPRRSLQHAHYNEYEDDEPRESRDPRPRREQNYPHIESNVPVSNKDLYYYMDDARLNDPLPLNAIDVADAPDVDDVDDDPPPAPSHKAKKKYTILEMENGAGGNRRSGSGAGAAGRRRFVQEEGEDGVAIVSLDNGPFPEFRLPTDRRQYMQHHYDDDDVDAPLMPQDAPREPREHHQRHHRHRPAPRSQQEDDLVYLS